MSFGIHSEQFKNNYSKEENQKFTVAFQELTDKFLRCMEDGLPATSEEVQLIAKEHFDFVSKFWKPNREAYKSLVTMYILPSPYRDYYENTKIGLGKYHYDALVTWAENNLD